MTGPSRDDVLLLAAGVFLGLLGTLLVTIWWLG